jgi:hypothetical protein
LPVWGWADTGAVLPWDSIELPVIIVAFERSHISFSSIMHPFIFQFQSRCGRQIREARMVWRLSTSMSTNTDWLRNCDLLAFWTMCISANDKSIKENIIGINESLNIVKTGKNTKHLLGVMTWL